MPREPFVLMTIRKDSSLNCVWLCQRFRGLIKVSTKSLNAQPQTNVFGAGNALASPTQQGLPSNR